MNKKAEINTRLKPRGIKLTGAYSTANTPTQFTCSAGHTWITAPANVLNGTGCRQCWQDTKRLNQTNINARLRPRGIVAVGGDYANTSTPTKFRCPQGHTWTTTPSSVLGGTGCPHCARVAPLTVEVINERLAPRGIKIVSDYTNSTSKAVFECSAGHQWQAVAYRVIQRTGCPECRRKKANDRKRSARNPLKPHLPAIFKIVDFSILHYPADLIINLDLEEENLLEIQRLIKNL